METKALILAGGSGTRLWPLSREMMPKQLLSLTNNQSLLQETIRRITPVIPPKDQMIITGKNHYFQVGNQIKNISMDIEILQEPYGKNTAPAIFWGAMRCLDLYGENCILVVLPSDHLITKEEAFIKALKKAIEKASEGCLVTFGITPSHPETGYGYIKLEKIDNDQERPLPIIEFTEKPDLTTATSYLEDGSYYWNSGIFVFHVGTLIEEAKKYCYGCIAPFLQSRLNTEQQIKNAYDNTINLSIDYAIMEKTDKAFAIPVSIGWSDVGSWESLFSVSKKDENGNVLHGESVVIDTKNCLIYGDQRLIATIGLEDLAVIDTPDALMISPLKESQRVREIVDKLKRDQTHTKAYIDHWSVQKQWGSYTILQLDKGFLIKKIMVNPGQSMLIKLEEGQYSHWTTIEGTGKLISNHEEKMLTKNSYTLLYPNSSYTLKNEEGEPIKLIEIQTNSYDEGKYN